MLLNDIGKVPATALRKINQHLESNYGFKITENIDEQYLDVIIETIHSEIVELKMQGKDAKSSPEISKRLLVLEGVKTLKEFAIMQFQSPMLEPVIKMLIDNVVEEFTRGGRNENDFHEAIKTAMNSYRSSKFRFPDHEIEERVRNGCKTALGGEASLMHTVMMR